MSGAWESMGWKNKRIEELKAQKNELEKERDALKVELETWKKAVTKQQFSIEYLSGQHTLQCERNADLTRQLEELHKLNHPHCLNCDRTEPCTTEEPNACTFDMTPKQIFEWCKSLKEKLVEAQQHDEYCYRGWNEAVSQLTETQTKLAASEQALEFYADPETYFAIGIFPDRPCGEFMDDFSETELGEKPGKRARAALGEGAGGMSKEE